MVNNKTKGWKIFFIPLSCYKDILLSLIKMSYVTAPIFLYITATPQYFSSDKLMDFIILSLST